MSKNSRRNQRKLFKEICDNVLGLDIIPNRKRNIHNIKSHKNKATHSLHKDSKETKIKRATGFRPFAHSNHGAE